MVKPVKKRFIVETVEITDCDTDESRIAKVITDTNELYSYDDLYELCELLNELAEENQKLDHQANFWHKKYRIVKTTVIRNDEE